MHDHEQLKNEIIKTEFLYSREFSRIEKGEFGFRFIDEKLPDMHCHNFYRMEKEYLAHLEALIAEEEAFRRSNGNEAVQVEVFDVDRQEVSAIVGDEHLSELIIMFCPSQELKLRDIPAGVSVHLAVADDDYQKGKYIDVISFGKEYIDFATRRYERKEICYSNLQSKMNNFICYRGEEVYGDCDFFYNGEYGKIEDFDVVEQHQRKGYGSAIIKTIVDYGIERGVNLFFLQVEKGNSAMEMYKKLGFRELFNIIVYNRPVGE